MVLGSPNPYDHQAEHAAIGALHDIQTLERLPKDSVQTTLTWLIEAQQRLGSLIEKTEPKIREVRCGTETSW